MYHLILILVLVASGGCWPMFEAEHKLNLTIARDSQPVGSSTTNSSAITIQTLTLSKEINTTLGGLVLLLTVGTYWLLVRYTTTLSNEIILPSKFLEDNMTAVLSLTWPKHFIGSQKETLNPSYKMPWVLFYMKQSCMHKSKEVLVGKSPFHEAQGSYDVKELPTFSQPRSFMVTVKAFSPVMKSLVQIAIWNSVSFWLVLVMIVNTLVYNGLVSNNITNDSIIRLVLVSVYAVANIGHLRRTTILLYRNFTFVLFQTCWTIICKEFIFLDYLSYIDYVTTFSEDGNCGYRHHLHKVKGASTMSASTMDWRSLNLELFGTMERSNTYRVLEDSDRIGYWEADGVFSMLSVDDKRRQSNLKKRDKTESKFDKFIKPLRETEIKAYEKATDSALEKTLANVAVLLGICLATALAPWTSTQKIDATGAQLGSYALLLSISTGLLALVNGITQLTNATDSARTLLLLQERTIETSHDTHESEDVSKNFSLRDEPKFGFSKGIPGGSQLTSFGLWRSTSLLGKLPCLLFGSALMLIPRFHWDRQRFRSRTALFFPVQDVTFACNTHGPNFSNIFRPLPNWPGPNVETGQKRENLQAGKGKYNDNTVKRQRKEQGINGNSDTSDAHP